MDVNDEFDSNDAASLGGEKDNSKLSSNTKLMLPNMVWSWDDEDCGSNSFPDRRTGSQQGSAGKNPSWWMEGNAQLQGPKNSPRIRPDARTSKAEELHIMSGLMQRLWRSRSIAVRSVCMLQKTSGGSLTLRCHLRAKRSSVNWREIRACATREALINIASWRLSLWVSARTITNKLH